MNYNALTLGRRLGQGGQGAVYQVSNKKINGIGGTGWEVVFKEYNPTSLQQLDPGALTAMANVLTTLSSTEGEWLCNKTSWPAAVVERYGRVCGILMRAAPDRFWFAFRSLAPGATPTRRVANMEFLLNSDAYITQIGLRITDRDRLALLADLAATLARLHRIGVAVGDLSPKNLLFTTTPRPECFLIDTDAMRLRGASVLPQAETPDWEIPSGEEKATPASDVYKFGLLAVRLFAGNQTTTDPAALTKISPALGTLARSSLASPAVRRPSPARWAEQLVVVAPPAPRPRTGPTPKITYPPPRRPPPDPGRAPRGGSGRKSPARKIAGVAGVAIAAAVAWAALHGHHPASNPVPSADAGRAQAGAVSALIAQSGTSRGQVVHAVAQVDSCADVAQGSADLATVEQDRQTQYTSAARLDISALPSGSTLKSDLLDAIKYSSLADQAYARWAHTVPIDCTAPAPTGPDFDEGNGYSRRAVEAKDRFLTDWTPIANTYGLPVPTDGDI